MSATKSRYDELHDRFFPNAKTRKAGTRYERLAAVVLKGLSDSNIVIHDFRLTGESKVKHQIDVLIEVSGKKTRALIECKDFDKSGKKVGLSVIRDFRSVVEDTKPDEAFVLTCNGFTQPARKFAKAKGIKLAIMRLFEEKDWEGRIKTIFVNLIIQTPPRLERLDLGLDLAQEKTFRAEVGAEGIPFPIVTKQSRFYFVDSGTRVQANEYLESEAMKIPNSIVPTPHEVSLDPDKWKIQIGSNAPLPFTHLKVLFRSFPAHTLQFQITSDRVAELILSGFGDNDLFIYADQLQKAKLDSEGRVTLENSSARGTRMTPNGLN